MDITISLDGFEVIASGVAIIGDNSIIEVNLTDESTERIKFRFAFQKGESLDFKSNRISSQEGEIKSSVSCSGS